MNVDIKKTARFLGNKDFLIILTLSFAGYVLLEKAGLFRLGPASYREIFHSSPSKALSVLFACNALAGLVFLLAEKSRNRIGYALFSMSIMVMAASLWVSINTRFEGKAVRAEMQTFNGLKADYIQQTLYMRDVKYMPQVGITLLKLNPSPFPDTKTLKEVTGEVLYAGRTTQRVLNGKLSSGTPFISDWTLIRITDFGYAPRYVLSDLKENALESSHRYMRLFPPGAEESFEAMFMGYRFYLKLYPDYIDKGGAPGTLSAEPRNPVYNLRIVRNKDIVYNGLLKPTEKLRFDNFIIAVPEVRMWAEMSFVRDLGLFILPFGLLLLLAGAALIAARK